MKQLRRLAATVFITVPLSTTAFAKPMPKKPVKDSTQQALLVELTGKDISKENDITLYAEMVGAYEKNDEIAFKSRLQSMMSRFPQSSYADNALFLAGRMAVDNNDYAQAIKYFSEIEKKYGKSNKAAAAKFAKGMTYKKMHLPEFAVRSLKEVRSRYPGSPESFRADAELKIIK
jgi:TolA-binding protein